jgi:ferredoxin
VTSAQCKDKSPMLIDGLACINIRGRVKTCAACQDACEWNALSLSLEGVSLDVTQCTACGACVPNCPVGALQLRGFSPQDFLQSLCGQQKVHIHCSNSSGSSCDSGNAVTIPCHSVLDARLLAAAYAAGTVSFHLHGLSQCDHCSKGSATGQVSLIQMTLRTWFEQQAPDVISVPGNEDEIQREHRPQDQSIKSRRGFLRGVGLRATAGAAAWLLPPENAHEYEPDTLPP